MATIRIWIGYYEGTRAAASMSVR